jgi:transcriptional regulator of acetoin/glycerol metabolism
MQRRRACRSSPWINIGDESYHGVRERMLSQFEAGYLVWLVSRAGGNMSKAARIAGVDRTTLYRLMDKHGLQRGAIITAR